MYIVQLYRYACTRRGAGQRAVGTDARALADAENIQSYVLNIMDSSCSTSDAERDGQLIQRDGMAPPEASSWMDRFLAAFFEWRPVDAT